MTRADQLLRLKSNLQILTNANDMFLLHLLDAGEAAVQVEGLVNDESVAYDAIIIDYAAYLFRKRGVSSAGGRTGETAMPRFLRWEINNLLMSQKAKAGMSE